MAHTLTDTAGLNMQSRAEGHGSHTDRYRRTKHPKSSAQDTHD
jgi:hypothetical protein